MITQQLTGDMADMSGRLVITAAPGALAELQSLAAELDLRDNVTTNGPIVIMEELPTPDEA